MQTNILPLKWSLLLATPLFLLFFLVLSKHSASITSILLFNISWLSVLITALSMSCTYVYCFTALMLFLGFWVKFFLHVQFGMVLNEPVGYWNFLPIPAWDRVLIVASMIALGLLAANWLLQAIEHKNGQRNIAIILDVPEWYKKNRYLAWSSVVLLAITVNIINFLGRIRVTAFTPKWMLPLHLNSLISWIIVFLLVSLLAAFIGWDYKLKARHRYVGYYLMLFIAAITSLSTLSRLFYVFWTLPYICLVFYYNRSITKLWRILINNKTLIAVYCLLAITLLLSITMVRKYYYYYKAPIISEASVDASSHELKSMIFGRWIGLEGVMATTAYPNANWSLFERGLLDMSEAKYTPGMYTIEILKPDAAHFASDTNNVFASLPGLGGVLNYANSLWVVFVGTCVVMGLLSLFELLTVYLVRNIFLTVQQSLLISYWCICGLNIPYRGLVYLVGFLLASLFIIAIGLTYNLWQRRMYSINRLST